VVFSRRIAGLAGAVACAAGALGASPATQAARAVASSSTSYYVALGASLAEGIGASSPAKDYVSLVYQHEAPRFGDLRLENLGCGGMTTTRFIEGPGCGLPELGRAESFMRAHPGRIAFITVDIGANELIPCIDEATVDAPCVAAAFHADAVNLPTIISGLRSAAPGVQIYGMTYYDPYLADWVAGPGGQTMAHETAAIVGELDSELSGIYTAAGIPLVDAAAAFGTQDFSLTGTYMGSTVPQNVASVCELTHMCSARDVHTNDAGHALLAATFERSLDAALAEPLAVSTASLPAATAAQSYSAAVSAAGGTPPYRWKRAAGKLPPGLRLLATGGVIEGVPWSTDRGTFTFTVQLSDQSRPVRSATKTLSIAVH
jgi:lysophospholipase L1-like esterase